jgi:NAD(P)-dependent dehydrogenase (short-subunit alcohol dehydrogenase family)
LPKVAVVTGGSSGIGAAVARRLNRDGWTCVLIARGEERLRRVADELRAEHEVCDVADREAVDRAARAITERYPALKLLVNSAGIPGRVRFLDSDPEAIERVLRINYLGSVWCLRAFLPALLAGAPSDVVNIVSVAGTVAFPPSGPYSASKHAQLAFSRATGAELRSRGIRVHTVNPGFVETAGFPQRSRLRSALMRNVVVEPDYIADRILRSIERDRREVFLPAWYRGPALIQALAPGLVNRLLASRGYRERDH